MLSLWANAEPIPTTRSLADFDRRFYTKELVHGIITDSLLAENRKVFILQIEVFLCMGPWAQCTSHRDQLPNATLPIKIGQALHRDVYL